MAFPTKFTEHLAPFFSLSYPVQRPHTVDSFPESNYYGIGPKDACLVITFIAIMAVLRDVLRIHVFQPFATWILTREIEQKKKTANVNGKANGNGVANGKGHTQNGSASYQTLQRKFHRSVTRFAEQGWPSVYYPAQFAFGLYVNYRLPTQLFNPIAVWVGYPHIPLAAPLKIYYLCETAFYVHQILILNAEAPRKDHWVMMTHHFITVFLMWTSYTYNFTRVGALIMVLMDWCDIILPIGKMMRYLNVRQLLCDLTFGLYLVSWLVTRHILFVIVVISTIVQAPKVVPFHWDPSAGRYFTFGSHMMFCVCLLALEVLQLVWAVILVRITWRVLTTSEGASDDRSDDES